MYKFLIYSLAFLAADAAIVKRWLVSEKPTGTLDADAPKNCEYWVSDITKDQLCTDLPKYFHMDMEDFLAMNPSLEPDCGGYQPGHSYCLALDQPSVKVEEIQLKRRVAQEAPTVATPSPLATGTVGACTTWYKVQQGDICNKILQQYPGVTLEQFLSWNPAVGPNCEYLIPGWNVCVGISPTSSPTPVATPTPSPTSKGPAPTASTPDGPVQPGTLQGCQKWYRVQEHDTCNSVVINNGISNEDFRKWNPQIDAACSNLWRGYNVCVGM